MNIIRCYDTKYLQYYRPLAAAISPLYQENSLAYYREYLQSDWRDESFVVVLGAQILARVYMTVSANAKQICYWGLPLQIEIAEDLTERAHKGCWKVLLKEFQRWQQTGLYQRWVYQPSSLTLDPMALWLLQQGYGCQLATVQQIELMQSSEQLSADLRPVYLSNIEWGQANLKYQLLDKSNATSGCLEAMRLFHIRIAGRETRSSESWRWQEQMLITGEAFALYGESQDGELISTGFFIYNSSRCYYGVGVYDRDKFSVPVSHDLVWRAMMHAKSLGCQSFEFGEVYFAGLPHPHGDAASEKELTISHFKRGFGGQILLKPTF